MAALGASWDEAEEAVAETLFYVFPRWKTIRNPRAYCRKAAERAWVHSEVRLRKAPEAALASTWGAPREVAPPGHDYVDQDYALRHLRALDQQQRRVMALVFDGYSPEEIAEILDKKASTVRSNIRHARKHLKEAIAKEQAAEAGNQVAPMSSTLHGGK
ncbi:RNA polymerase sigma factor [Actinacidiphila glaucinigra]|uniref:RNA polymerase sigma factor n=1 Tax=Actinacidiphila glaucinigra TaxID=235986 RepID=UPI0015C61E3F|nr:RNA polymerase sigma factor [Actinacidiphila glaucinigra]